eukprot:681605-Rhodomonas_salina.3
MRCGVTSKRTGKKRALRECAGGLWGIGAGEEGVQLVKGYVSTEVDPRLSFDKEVPLLPILLCPCYAMSGTGVVLATPCPVLT